MKTKQQFQTLDYFQKNAKKWSTNSEFKRNKILNTIHERNLFVLKIIKKFKLKKHLDVGCGTGDLCFASSKITNLSVGIDFSKSMIDIGNKKFSKKNLKLICQSIFDYKEKIIFDAISANGFIEYLSLKQIKEFIQISKNNLKKNGYIILGSRNRLYNLFSLNEFSKKEIKRKTFKDFYFESINLTKLTLRQFLKLRKIKFNEVPFKQPKTVINVDRRHQFSPSQLINLLEGHGFKVVDIVPIKYHPVIPKIYNKNLNYNKISNYILQEENKLSLIPFSSSFMIAAKMLS